MASYVFVDGRGVRTDVRSIIPPGKRVLKAIANQGWLNVFEGAVRSGKTMASTIAWLYYISKSDDEFFLMTGKSLGSLLRNVYDGDMGLKAMVPNAYIRSTQASTAIIIPTPKGNKVCYCFGGGNANSHETLVGLTVGGWYADEVSECHPRFVEECFNRTVVSSDRKHFWTLNPQNPKHFIYSEYLDKYDKWTPEENKRAGGYYWHHFTLEDNPALTSEMISAISQQYSGYAYNRYVLGLRVVPEGLIYGDIPTTVFQDFDRELVDNRYCAIDFGATHATVMYIGGPYNGDRKDWRISYEYYDEDSGKTTDEYVDDFERLCADAKLDPKRLYVAIDPSAKALKNSFASRGYNFFNASNDVLDGILYCQRYLNQHKVKIHKSCENLEREFGIYRWDAKASERGEDRPIKENDDACDAFRYFVMSHARQALG